MNVMYDEVPHLGPPGQDDVRLAGHEDELQAAGRAGAHHLQHLLLRAVQPHLQSARAPDEAMQQPGEFRQSEKMCRQLVRNPFIYFDPFCKKVIMKPTNCEA